MSASERPDDDGHPPPGHPPSGPESSPGAAAPGEPEGTPDDAAAPADPDAATVRRARPRRGDTGQTPVADPATGSETAVAPHRPVPPVFPSPGQPPPGVARRTGRHARRESQQDQQHTPPEGYRPRHAAPDAETERFPAVTGNRAGSAEGVPVAAPPSATGPGGTGPPTLRPVPDPDPGPGSGPGPSGPVPRIDAPSPVPRDGAPPPGPSSGPTGVVPDGPAPAAASARPETGPIAVPQRLAPGLAAMDPADADRVRVVLAERRVPTRAVRTVAEIEQQTETGELLLRNLLRSQLTLGLRLGAVAILLLGALPVLFLVLPDLGAASLLGVRVPWWVLGLVPYPVMLVLAWFYTRTAERNELDFADNVED